MSKSADFQEAFQIFNKKWKKSCDFLYLNFGIRDGDGDGDEDDDITAQRVRLIITGMAERYTWTQHLNVFVSKYFGGQQFYHLLSEY